MAAPFVAGIAALVKSLHPQMTGAQLKAALKSTVDELPQLSTYCNTGGKINAYEIEVKSSGAAIYYNSGQYYPGEGIASTDKRRIYVK